MITSRTCLKPMVSEESIMMIRLHRHYSRGVLPFAGGLLDQPSAFIHAMELIDGR